MGNNIIKESPDTNKFSENYENNKFKVGISSMQGWRIDMEDAYLINLNLDENTSIFGIFDGHGGIEISKICSEFFIDILKETNYYKEKDFINALEQTFIKLDEFLKSEEGLKEIGKIIDDPSKSKGGSTVNIALIHNKDLYVANAGDSRCYIYNSNNPKSLSFDHKPYLDVEIKRIINAGGFIENGRINGNLNLSRALGDFEYKKNLDKNFDEQIVVCIPDVIKYEITEKDQFIIMGCDGIWEILTPNEICSIINKRIKSNPFVKLSIILEEILDKSLAIDSNNILGLDNMTAILIQFKI